MNQVLGWVDEEFAAISAARQRFSEHRQSLRETAKDYDVMCGDRAMTDLEAFVMELNGEPPRA
jgi:hypothetical protein